MNRPIRTALFVIGCLLAATLVLACAGCGMLGIATVDDLNDESAKLQTFARAEAEARQVATHTAIVQAVRPLDLAFPALSDSVAATLTNAPFRPTPQIDPRPNESQLPWWAEELASGVVLAGLTYFGINRSRDAKRRAMGEATNVAEAIQLGQVPVKAPTA